MCGVFGGRRGRTGVGIVGRGACGALTKTCVWRFAGKAGECEATERGGGEAMASDADDGDGDAARRTAGVSDRQARAGVASAGKRQHQVPLIGIGQCHAMTASNQVNFYTYMWVFGGRGRGRRGRTEEVGIVGLGACGVWSAHENVRVEICVQGGRVRVRGDGARWRRGDGERCG